MALWLRYKAEARSQDVGLRCKKKSLIDVVWRRGFKWGNQTSHQLSGILPICGSSTCAQHSADPLIIYLPVQEYFPLAMINAVYLIEATPATWKAQCKSDAIFQCKSVLLF